MNLKEYVEYNQDKKKVHNLNGLLMVVFAK